MRPTLLPPVLRADKALARQVADIDESLDNVEDFVELIATDATRQGLRRAVVLLRKRLVDALDTEDPRVAAKPVAALVKDAAKLADQASEAHGKDLADRALPLLQKLRALMARAMVEVGRVEPVALRLPLQREQAALRLALNELESERCATPAGIAAMEKLQPQVEEFIERLEPARRAGEWARGQLAPLRARVEAAVKRVPAERCRRCLLAELDFIDADANKALARGDVKAAQAGALPALQRIERLAARVSAAAPAVDRELLRLARLLAGSGDATLGKRLRALVQERAATWPAGADAEAIDAALGRFEAELGRLAADVAAAARAPAKA